MPAFKKIALALVLSAAAALPAAAAEGFSDDGSAYRKETMERYMPNTGRVPAVTTNNGLRGDLLLRVAPRRDFAPMRQESAPGFGG